MTSTNPPSAQSTTNAANAASAAPSPVAAGPNQLPGRFNVSAAKKPYSPPTAASSNPSPAVGGLSDPPHHAAGSPTSPVNGRNPIQPAVPAVGQPNAANPSAMNGSQSQPDHSRKSSVTISAQGTSGYLQNGGPVAPSGRPPINFGSMNVGGSPAIANSTPHHAPSASLPPPLADRITDPTKTPSPIPQPQPGASSGGRPPSGFQGQGNGPVFGSTGGESGETNVSIAPRPQNLSLRAFSRPPKNFFIIFFTLCAAPLLRAISSSKH